ncbi:MAG TPA: cytochrome C [Anaeromyxobacteraceae bacterium]|nr:cytochrome C [Anaeromyxobacteraceae bacterium]
MHTKITRLIVAAALALGFGKAYAFHAGGVADCAGCHSMHSPAAGGVYLLINSDQSSTCLSCHGAGSTTSSYHVATQAPIPAAGPQQFGPGGDFSWLNVTYTWAGRNNTVGSEPGASHGHNIIAADYGLTTVDGSTAPGGTFNSANLGCQSCHDPHGQLRRLGGDTTYTFARSGAPTVASGSYDTSPAPTATLAVGAYRLLRGAGDSTQGVTYNGVFLAVAPSTYNRTEAFTQTRVAYGSSGANTVGQWCMTCHPAMHSDPSVGTSNYVHPVDRSLGSTIKGNYDSYVSSGILTGSNASAFLSLVPFAEDGATGGDFAVLKTHAKNNDSVLTGPATTDKVMCLSCHRAHASGFEYGTRWNVEFEFLTIQDGTGAAVYPGTDVTPVPSATTSMGRTQAQWQTSYYGRPATKFGVGYQRSLCNKCHVKD